MTEKMYPIYHKHSGDLSIACNELGLYTTVENPEVGDPLNAKYFFRLDGKQCEVDSPAICGSCGRPIAIAISDIDYENPVEVENHGS